MKQNKREIALFINEWVKTNKVKPKVIAKSFDKTGPYANNIAHYKPDNKEIFINLTKVTSKSEALKSLKHEIAHYYQHAKFGWLFIPLYKLLNKMVGYRDNPFEEAARIASLKCIKDKMI